MAVHEQRHPVRKDGVLLMISDTNRRCMDLASVLAGSAPAL